MSAVEALRRTAFEILEDGLFMMLDETEPTEPDDAIRFTMAIDGDGDPPREVGMAVARPVGRELAANLLGIDFDEVTPDDVSAAVAETLNMVAGRLMVHVVGEGPVLELHPPESGGAAHGDVIGFGDPMGRVTFWYAA